MKISACAGRSAPPDSTRLMIGSRFFAAISPSRLTLLQRDRVDRPAAYGRVVRDHHALDAFDHADAADDRCADRVVGREPGDRAQLQKRRVPVDEQFDPLARQQASARVVPGHVLLAAARSGRVQRVVQLSQPLQHRAPVVQIGRSARVDRRTQDRHLILACRGVALTWAGRAGRRLAAARVNAPVCHLANDSYPAATRARSPICGIGWFTSGPPERPRFATAAAHQGPWPADQIGSNRRLRRPEFRG